MSQAYYLFLKSDNSYQGNGVDMAGYAADPTLGLTAVPTPDYDDMEETKRPYFIPGDTYTSVEGYTVYNGEWEMREPV